MQALLEKYPNTSKHTLQLVNQALTEFYLFETMHLLPEKGGRDDQTDEWVRGLKTAYAAKAEADEERALEDAIRQASESSLDDEDITEY